MTILEHLKEVRQLLSSAVSLEIYSKLNSCVELLEKGFIPEADVEDLLEKFKSIEKIPSLDELIAGDAGELPHDGVTNKTLEVFPKHVKADLIIGFYPIDNTRKIFNKTPGEA